MLVLEAEDNLGCWSQGAACAENWAKRTGRPVWWGAETYSRPARLQGRAQGGP